MKKIFIIIIALIFLLSGCNTQTNVDTPSEVPSEYPSQREESKIIPEDIYDFLSSKYYVTARNESMGNIYEYVFYFDEGVVVGTKTVSTLTSEKLAESYAESLKNDDAPCVFLEGNTVTAYYGDDYEAYYQGYSLEKLKFVLEKMGYEYTVEFLEEEFYEEFSEVSEE